MKPIIKWPGGKSGEIRQFEHLIPEYDRYIEPFVGGGALFFHLNPERAVINDTSENLMELYALVQRQDPELHRILVLYCRSFGALQESCERHGSQLLELYRVYRCAASEGIDARELGIHHALVDQVIGQPFREVAQDLILDWDEYRGVLHSSVQDKILRTAANDRKKPFSAKDLKDCLVTGFTGGFYLYFRDIFNEIAAGRLLCPDPYRIANFYFVREYCYGSMFRYNAEGAFNIPYGGISYNKKDLSEKVAQMFSPQMAALLDRTQICCEDFQTLLGELKLTERDFLFLDPPYDTEFSEYERHAFGPEDQRRLAEFLKETKAQFLLVIKNTDFIYNLYAGQFRILSFENRYVYNVRSRNDRMAQHLIITNVPEYQVPWLRENV